MQISGSGYFENRNTNWRSNKKVINVLASDIIPKIYDKLGQVKLGDLTDTLVAYVEEERNGLFELTLDYPNNYPLSDKLEKECIVIANANDTLRNQKFRIYDTQKFIDGTITVFARHISFDLMYDIVNNVTFTNQSCEYALNQLFRQSQFSTHYRGYSDIINAQDYSMSMCNILEAIGGKEGSIIDTYGTGAEILRDNTDIHVLNRRGHDNSVSIEYAKNLTGFELEEDTTDLITRIIPYAKYTDEASKEVIVKANAVDSPLINNYSHPYVRYIDFSDKFENGEIPSQQKLIILAQNEYRDNKVDIPKQNYKIEFIPLSKCVGYEGIEDKISLCDLVTIKNSQYNINTQAKVIKYKFNVLTDRYESMELGEPKTSLGDIIGGGGGNGEDGKPGPPGPPGEDGNMGDFPDSLPSKSVLTGKSIGLASIELSWTFENKVYYSYELYASKSKDFTPNSFDLIHEGQTSSYLFQAKPNETWYFRVCGINSYGNRGQMSDQVSVTTSKINGEDWIEKATIGQALIGELSADVITSGKFTGHYIDARNLSVTDGNGKRTLDIDSFGNVNLDVTTLKIKATDVEKVLAQQTIDIDGVKTEVKDKVSNSEFGTKLQQSAKDIQIGFNGINNRININPRSMDFTSANGNRDMSLYGGQLCAFNSGSNNFLATTGSIIADNYNINGAGFLLSKHCNHFLIGRDANWNDIFTNRSPSPTHYFDIDFDKHQIKLGLPLLTGDINLKGNSLYDAHVGYMKDWYGFGWRLHSDGHQLMYAEGHRIKFNVPVSFDGNTLMAPDLYTDAFKLTNGHLAFCKNPRNPVGIANGSNWDWQGYEIIYAYLKGCINTNYVTSGKNIDVENDVNVLIANEAITDVREDGSTEYELNEMIKLLYSKIHNLEKEIENLKAR